MLFGSDCDIACLAVDSSGASPRKGRSVKASSTSAVSASPRSVATSEETVHTAKASSTSGVSASPTDTTGREAKVGLDEDELVDVARQMHDFLHRDVETHKHVRALLCVLQCAVSWGHRAMHCDHCER